MKSAGDGWKAPLYQPGVCDVKVHCNAEILTGVQFVNSPKQCEELLCQFPEAVAIEHEGQGVYSAAFDREIEWVLVKGISHYADGAEPETKEWRRFSSVMAASVVNHILNEPDVLKDWPHYQDAR